ncbi:hypothetical protein LWI28_022613 [Acer negundo]|uniref:Uncharacterized protein n=1 Tax=Acer negundo TaxID=4023 RepID=A0AAD5IS03_ACENE|nr:hypothetical protein LWI28_022613 [Acer negundo]
MMRLNLAFPEVLYPLVLMEEIRKDRCDSPSGEDKNIPILVETHVTLKKSKNTVGYKTRGALYCVMLLDKTKHRHSLGDSVMSPDIISPLSFAYNIPKSVALVVPSAGYNPTKPKEGNLPLPLCTFNQRLRLPLHPFMKKVPVGLEIASFQLGPLEWRNIIAIFRRSSSISHHSFVFYSSLVVFYSTISLNFSNLNGQRRCLSDRGFSLLKPQLPQKTHLLTGRGPQPLRAFCSSDSKLKRRNNVAGGELVHHRLLLIMLWLMGISHHHKAMEMWSVECGVLFLLL